MSTLLLAYLPRPPSRLVLAASAIAAICACTAIRPAGAQGPDQLSGVILRGPSLGAARPQSPAPPAALVPGIRVESPEGSWTEIAFSDGSVVVLEQGADFTLQSIARDKPSGRFVVRAAASRGRLRISTSSNLEIVLSTAGSEVRVIAASAVIQAGAGGSATLLAGQRMILRDAGGRETEVRRPGFGVSIAGGGVTGPERRSRDAMTTAVDSFAPVQRPGGPSDTTGDLLGSPLNSRIQPVRPPLPPLPPLPSPSTPPVTPAGFSPGDLGSPRAGQVGPSGTGGFGFGAPGANRGTSSIDTQNRTGAEDTEVAGAQIGNIAGYARLGQGTGRVRRFAPGASGALGTRSDDGVVSVAQGGSAPATRVVGAFQLRLADETLPTTPSNTFYDATARLGVVTLQVDTPLRDENGLLTFRKAQVPRISIADAATPRTERPEPPATDPSGFSGAYSYFGSAIGEIGLRDATPADGRVARLSGEDGLIMAAGGTLPSRTELTGGLEGGVFQFVTLPPYGVDRGGTPTEIAARVVIVDKITASSERIFAERGIQPGERFFAIGGTPLAPSGPGLPGRAPGQVTRFAISDGLNPRGGFREGETVEQQFNSSSRPVAFSRFNSFRPEESFVAGPADPRTAPIGRGDTQLLAVSGSATTPTAALRGEVEVTGAGPSSVSVSVGGIAPYQGSLVLSGSTVGTVRRSTQETSLALRSSLGSLGTDAAGTGAHVFPSASDPAQAGYFAVGTQDIRRGAPGSDGGQPGTIEVVGGSGSAPFGFTRLATNVGVGPGAQPPSALSQGGDAALRGFAAGIVESVGGGAVSLHGVSTSGPGGVTIDRSSGSNEFTARVGLSSHAAGDLASNPAPAPAPNGVTGRQALIFGGRDTQTGQPTTAWVGQSTFGAVVPGQAAMVSVDRDLLAGIVAGGSAMPPSDEHLAWGLFLGDLVNDAPGARRDHVNLGFWVAGRPVDPGTLSTLRGTSVYAGGMIGTVAEPGTIRTATGNFTQNWDFGARSGTLAAAFDGRSYGVNATMPAGAAAFTGTGVSNGRQMSVQGGFFDATGTTTAGRPPAAVGGAFGIAGSGYGANGIFAGTRR